MAKPIDHSSLLGMRQRCTPLKPAIGLLMLFGGRRRIQAGSTILDDLQTDPIRSESAGDGWCMLCAMIWNVVTMRTDLSDLEVAGFVRGFTAAHVREVQSGLKREYRLYRRILAGTSQIVFIPPDAVHLAEQTPTWGKQIKQLSEPPI